MKLENNGFKVSASIQEDISHLKLVKEGLTSDYANLIFLKKDFVLASKFEIVQTIMNVTNDCITLIHSIEMQLINYSTYISLANQKSDPSASNEIYTQMESLRLLSDLLYKELDNYKQNRIEMSQFFHKVA